MEHITSNLARVPKRLPFWERIYCTPSGCWGWVGSHHPGGYGIVLYNGRYERAHRVAYELTYGPIPKGLFILHNCDNRWCCNPAHLRAGTQKENIADCFDRGRTNRAHGERSGTAKLTLEQVRTIRAEHAAGISQSELARRYGVYQSAISSIVRRITWRSA